MTPWPFWLPYGSGVEAVTECSGCNAVVCEFLWTAGLLLVLTLVVALSSPVIESN